MSGSRDIVDIYEEYDAIDEFDVCPASNTRGYMYDLENAGLRGSKAMIRFILKERGVML